MKPAIPNQRQDNGCLSDRARQQYLVVLHGGPTPDPNDPDLRQLVDLGLIAPHPDNPDERYIALDPTLAAERHRDRLLGQAEDAIAKARVVVDRVQDLAVAYRGPVSDLDTHGVEHLAGIEAVNSRLAEIVASASYELLTAQPTGPRARAMLDISRNRDLDALRRGVAMRTLYRATARSDHATAEWVSQMTAAGAHIRTIEETFERAVIVDRRIAVISDHTPWTGVGPEPVRAVIVHDPALAHYAAAQFTHDWDRAAIWAGTLERPDAEITEMQAHIMRRLAAGMLQSALADELRLSQRSVTHQISLLKQVAGVQTLFELAIWWDRRVRDGRDGASAP